MRQARLAKLHLVLGGQGELRGQIGALVTLERLGRLAAHVAQLRRHQPLGKKRVRSAELLCELPLLDGAVELLVLGEQPLRAVERRRRQLLLARIGRLGLRCHLLLQRCRLRFECSVLALGLGQLLVGRLKRIALASSHLCDGSDERSRRSRGPGARRGTPERAARKRKSPMPRRQVCESGSAPPPGKASPSTPT